MSKKLCHVYFCKIFCFCWPILIFFHRYNYRNDLLSRPSSFVLNLLCSKSPSGLQLFSNQVCLDQSKRYLDFSCGARKRATDHFLRSNLSSENVIHLQMACSLNSLGCQFLLSHWWLPPSVRSCGGYNYDSTLIQRPFDGYSTSYQRSLRSQWCNPLAAVTRTCLFT